ncbi:MAG TPA: AAA family ATPase [Pirellulales bacterium]|nr:AAA family ATPase [Pirellulales bacterium]
MLHPGPDPFFEIRALDIPGRGKPHTASGYFSDYQLAAEQIVKFDGEKTPGGIYVTMNPPDADLHARSPDEIREYIDPVTNDDNILRRRHIIFDCDAHRPAKVMAREEQRGAAMELAHDIEEFLKSHGWPLPQTGMSGSGYYLLYRVELPNDKSSLALVEKILKAVDHQFQGRGASVDIGMGNASRIIRVFGTMNRKGFSTERQPHRLAELYEPPDTWEVVPQEKLEAIAALLPEETATNQRNNGNGHTNRPYTGESFDLAGFMHRHGIEVARTGPWKEGGKKYILNVCPFNPDHTNGAAFIAQQPNGAIVAGCHHNGCKSPEWTWHELRELYEPGCHDRARDRDRHERHERRREEPQQEDLTPIVVDHKWMTFADFMAQDARQSYLVEEVVPEAMGGIISGRFKTLKTGIALDLLISLRTGCPFLGKFAVPKPMPCAFMTCETSPANIIHACRRICDAKGIDYREGPHISQERANMMDDRHLERLEREIDANGWRCVALDPTYLLFSGLGEFCNNVFKMGKELARLTDLVRRTGCSIIPINHNTKHRARDIERFAPPELSEISMSGFAEWMRFWLLLSQSDEWDEETGHHHLWMRTGGAGHASLFGVDVVEGPMEADKLRHKWEVSITGASQTRREQKSKKENAAAKKKEATEARQLASLLEALGGCEDFESKNVLKEKAGLHENAFGPTIRTAIDLGRVETKQIVKYGNECQGYRLIRGGGREGREN